MIDLSPYYRIVPAGQRPPEPGAPIIRFVPGAGWGTGQHPTTQLCLLALGYLLRGGLAPGRVLDFGAGSGLLAVAAAKSGATVEAVESDAAGLTHARAMARENRVAGRIAFRRAPSEPFEVFDLILANILRPVLLDCARVLCARLAPSGRLLLSGLVATDVPHILARYVPLLPGWGYSLHRRGEWRAVLFAPEGLAQ